MTAPTVIPIRLAILGTGAMARQHAERFAAIEGVTVVAGIDVDQVRADTFCKTYGIGRAFGNHPDALTPRSAARTRRRFLSSGRKGRFPLAVARLGGPKTWPSHRLPRFREG